MEVPGPSHPASFFAASSNRMNSAARAVRTASAWLNTASTGDSIAIMPLEQS
jgi:hypothetical protein